MPTKVEILLVCLFGLLVLFFVACGVDACMASRETIATGTVVVKNYTPAKRSSGTGWVFNGKNSGPVYVTTSTIEKWEVVVDCENEVLTIDADPIVWVKLEAGSKVKVTALKGVFGNYSQSVEINESKSMIK